MLRSMLVGLDGTADCDAALELAIRWSRETQALVVGLGVIDEPGIHGSEEMLVGEVYFQKLNESLATEARHQVEHSLSRYARRCAEAGVPFKELEDVGAPYSQILKEAQRYDLILLGQETHFQYGWKDLPDGTIGKVLSESSRPVVAVPDVLEEGTSVLIAYDGSLQAARALYAFEASGLGLNRSVEIMSVGQDYKDAARNADRAVEFLRFHNIQASSHVIHSTAAPGGLILDRVRQQNIGLLVMGAYGQPILKEFFLGSVTRTVMKESPVPVFLYH